MDEKAIFKLCKDEGCCDVCCLRYLGLKHQRVYENVKEWVAKYTEEPPSEESPTENGASSPEAASGQDGANGTDGTSGTDGTDGTDGTNGTDEPAAKRARGAPCAACLGLLEPATWPDTCQLAKDTLDKKGYDCTSFACALSAPIACLLREKYLLLTIKERVPLFDPGSIPSLKEVWKWSFGPRLAASLSLALDSGAVAPLLVTVHYEYPDDQELDILKSISPSSFSNSRHSDLTRRGADQALDKATLENLRALRPPAARARCVAVGTQRAPMYLGGRYVKLSRQLPQTPWLVRGQRVMPSSVQEIIFKPIAELYGLSAEESEHRLKFVAAGREDVDVRCRGEGRPFAVEIADPRRELTTEELERACRDISGSGAVVVETLVPVSREDLNELKKGEETKCKEYEVLCIKLARTEFDDPTGPIAVTPEDVARVNSYRNTEPGDAARVRLVQRTPVRVLHRRPLLARQRAILDMEARLVEGHPQLFVVRATTTAGTYVKEWAHGELGRTEPALGRALAAPCDVAALDVTRVALPWPPAH